MLKSFYNPDDQQHLEYHKELLKMAAQDRLAGRFAQAGSPQGNSKRARMSLFEHLQRLFNIQPGAGAVALKHQK